MKSLKCFRGSDTASSWQAHPVTRYRLVFHGLDTARIKVADDPTSAPLAWFRLAWMPGTNDVEAVHVYGHAERVAERPWLSICATIRDAVTYCDILVPGTPVEADYDWSGGTLEES